MTIETEAGASYCQCSMNWGINAPVSRLRPVAIGKFFSFSRFVRIDLSAICRTAAREKRSVPDSKDSFKKVDHSGDAGGRSVPLRDRKHFSLVLYQESWRTRKGGRFGLPLPPE